MGSRVSNCEKKELDTAHPDRQRECTFQMRPATHTKEDKKARQPEDGRQQNAAYEHRQG
jgi:hypothetical protein